MSVKTFIDRPVLAGVISVLIVILGILGLVQLPIEQFPNIAPPTVRVSATYTGANAETVQKSVIVPLEESLNGVEDMMYMTSTATNTGAASISIYFKQGTDADMAVVNVQNRVASAQGLLPAEVTKSGVTVRKRQNSTLKSITLYSPDNTFDTKFLTNYMKINIEPQISRIAGVGEVNVFSADYAMRIWLDPARMSQYGLVPADIDKVLASQNIESPTGTIGAESAAAFQYVLKYRGRYEDAEDYGNLVIKALPDGNILRLDDVATIELGSESLSRFNLFPAISVYGEQGEGYSSGEALEAIKQTAARCLPTGYGYEFGGMSREESSAGNTTTLIFSICLAFIYLILCALYESLTIPFAVIAAVPFGLAGSFLFARSWGLENNIYMQIGLIMLIGLLAKTAILLTEYATARRKEGMSLTAAAVSASKARFRPILMTSLTMIFGMLPLMFASGVGANGNISVGVGTVGGLLFGTLALLFIVPVLFIVFQYLHEKIQPAHRRAAS